ncbi:hypothetical protein XOC_0384 [Xanthomonas oryzae pv. oryzicola BLS256]|uniref:Uncharacterized protein n=1 Tax=Xanthomonas oryzae pv. oryzicola (strain BLS256) TaxID=383407 RepID=G7TLJ4_XANOB|nr:hypothetical protein XOC_0384 [Xanthomonas oryzae pv. oryzicola BLS256]
MEAASRRLPLRKVDRSGARNLQVPTYVVVPVCRRARTAAHRVLTAASDGTYSEPTR